jgi:hypothetical protein
MNPAGEDVHLALGTILLAKGDRAGAAQEFQQELRFFPQSQAAQTGLARAAGNAVR